MITSRSVVLSSLLLAFAAGCGLDAVVGGECRAGFAAHGGRCVPSFASGGDAPATDTSPTSDMPRQSTSPTEPASFTPPHSAPDGDADAASPPPDAGTPPLGPDAGTPPPPPPALTCDLPLVLCHGACIPVDSDALNCGACGRICPSNICIAGQCAGATPGDVVVIGHAMTSSYAGSVHAKIVANAVSIPTTDPIRVLSYEDGAEAGAASATRATLVWDIPRQVQFTTASPQSLESEALYASYDVVLVHGAAVADPAALGARWAHALQTFTQRGGVFVAIDGGESDVPALVDATGLVTLGSHLALALTTHFLVTGANDVVGARLLSPFAAFGASVAFPSVTESADLRVVVRTDDDASLPTVIHAIAR